MEGTTLDTIRDIRLYQSKDGYRFSVDALLLFSFVNLSVARKIADLGAGSGIIGILLARKYRTSRVLLIELQESLLKLARENVRLNHVEERVGVIGCDIRQVSGGAGTPLLAGGSYDLVVSNPPFRRTKTGLLSPGEEKAVARHEVKLKLPELVRAARHLLRSRGRLFLIYHPERLVELIGVLREEGFEIKRLRFVHSDPSSEAKMALVEAVKGGRTGLKVERPLWVYRADGAYSDEVYEICHGTLRLDRQKGNRYNNSVPEDIP